MRRRGSTAARVAKPRGARRFSGSCLRRSAATHQIPQGELTLKQTYQALSGTLRSEGKTVAVEGKVLGEEVFLNAGGRALRGKVNGKRLEIS